MKSIAVFLAIALSLHGCFLKPASDGCSAGSARCAGSTVQVCNSDGQWRTLHACEAITAYSGRRLVCEADAGTAACVAVDAGGE